MGTKKSPHPANRQQAASSRGTITFHWLYQVLDDFDYLLPVDTQVALQFTRHFDKDGYAFPSLKYIGDAIGASEHTVLRSTRRLQQRGHLQVKWGKPGRKHANQYWMVLKPAPVQFLADQKTCTGAQENLHPCPGKPAPVKNKPAPVQENHKSNHKGNHGGNHTVRAAPQVGVGGSQHGTAPVVDGSDQHDADFEAFWQVYPKQVGQREAKREFKKALQQATAEEIIAGARRYATDPVRIKQSQGPEGDRFTKNPNNWLREGRWADKLASVTIDEHGNPVAQPPARQNGGGVDEYLAHVLTDLYPNGRWS